MKKVKRKAKIGEKIVVTSPKKGWNAHDDELKGTVMTVNRVHARGVYTKEFSLSTVYINHEGYEVVFGD